jgi:hypothetical protein
MLLRVGLDESIPADSAGDAPGGRTAAHRRLLEVLMRESIVVIPADDALQRLHERVTVVQDSAVRTLWLTAMARLRYLPNPKTTASPIEELYDAAALERDWGSGTTSVAVVEPTRAELFGLAQGSACFEASPGGPEVTRYDSIDSSDRFRRMRESSTDVAAGVHRDTVWNERFALLADTSREVIIIDRYIGKNLVHGRANGITWLATKIAASGAQALTIVTGCATSYSHSDIANAADKVLGPCAAGLRTAQLVISDDSAFYAGHARHVRFDRSAALLVEPGCDVFNTTTAKQTYPCFMIDPIAAIARETEVRKRRIARHEFWTDI